MAKLPIQLLSRDEIATGTLRYRFTKPEGFSFQAGQYATMVLVDPPYKDKKGLRRPLTIASAPTDEVLEFTWRVSDSAFKRTMAEAPLGTTCEIVGPIGSFTLHDDATVPAVCVAGGIGITPFRSILRDAVARDLPHPITLIYCNRDPEGAAYLDELMQLAAARPSLELIVTMTRAEGSTRDWDGLCRRVDLAFLRETVEDLAAPIYYVAGPPRIISAMTEAITDAGGDLTRIRKDEFTGY